MQRRASEREADLCDTSSTQTLTPVRRRKWRHPQLEVKALQDRSS